MGQCKAFDSEDSEGIATAYFFLLITSSSAAFTVGYLNS